MPPKTEDEKKADQDFKTEVLTSLAEIKTTLSLQSHSPPCNYVKTALRLVWGILIAVLAIGGVIIATLKE